MDTKRAQWLLRIGVAGEFLGHGLLAIDNLDVKKALRDCDLLDTKYRNYCYDGVFMENAFDANSTNFNPADPWALCNNLEEQYHYNCARYQSQFFLGVLHWDFARTGAGCVLAPSGILRTTCLESLGYHAAQNNQGNYDSIVKSCSVITGGNRDSCITGSAREVIFQAYQDWSMVSEKLCFLLSADAKSKCLESNARTKLIYKR